MKSLPTFYTDVAPYTIKEKEPEIPPIPESFLFNFTANLDAEMKVEDAWLQYVRDAVEQEKPQAILVFQALSRPVRAIEEHHLKLLTRYVILTYNITSDLDDIDQARKALFVRGRAMDRLPPTFDALLQHTKRACLQAGFIWGQSLLPNPEYPNCEDWGWKKEGSVWVSFWTIKEGTTASLKELTRCSCKRCIKGRCLCRQSGLPCTGLCVCEGDSCDRNQN